MQRCEPCYCDLIASETAAHSTSNMTATTVEAIARIRIMRAEFSPGDDLAGRSGKSSSPGMWLRIPKSRKMPSRRYRLMAQLRFAEGSTAISLQNSRRTLSERKVAFPASRYEIFGFREQSASGTRRFVGKAVTK